MSTVARGVHARTRPGRSAPRAQSGRHVGSVPSRSSPSVRAHRCARARVARVVRVRSVDEAEDVNAEADKDAEADERTFAPDVEAIAKGGLAKALPEVDARLRLAMRGESAGAQSDTDADALTAKRAASTAEDQAVDIVACLKQAGDLRGYGGARLVPRRDYALSELKLNGIEAEKLLSPTESTISGLRDLISRAMVVLVGGWVFAAHPSGSQVTGLLVTGGGRWRLTRWRSRGDWRRWCWTPWRRRRVHRTGHGCSCTRRRTFWWRTSWAFCRKGTLCLRLTRITSTEL